MEDVLNIVVSNPLARKIFRFHVVVGGVCAQRLRQNLAFFWVIFIYAMYIGALDFGGVIVY